MSIGIMDLTGTSLIIALVAGILITIKVGNRIIAITSTIITFIVTLFLLGIVITALSMFVL